MKNSKLGIIGIFVVIIIVILILFFLGFIDRERVKDLKDDEYCVKWDENNTKCLGYEKTKSSVKDWFTREVDEKS